MTMTVIFSYTLAAKSRIAE